MRQKAKAKVGVFGIGLAAYWPQFRGLKERLEGYQRQVEQRIGEWATVVSGGWWTMPRRPAKPAKVCVRPELIWSSATWAPTQPRPRFCPWFRR